MNHTGQSELTLIIIITVVLAVGFVYAYLMARRRSRADGLRKRRHDIVDRYRERIAPGGSEEETKPKEDKE